MLFLGLLVVFLSASSIVTSAQASAFADFNQGLEARNRNDADAAIAAFSRALTGGDLLPGLKPVALYDRGEAYQRKQEYAEAVADFSAVIKQEPDNPEAYARRSESSLALGNYEAATQDCEQLTLLKPNSATLWAACGRIAFMAGRFDQAASHFRRALQFGERDRNASYDLLWLGLTGLKSGRTAAGEMSGPVQSGDRHAWPAPLVEFFGGQIGEDALQGAAAAGDATAQKAQQCEVGFYLGEWKLAYQKKAEAESLFQTAVQLCPKNFIELYPAKSELKKIQQAAMP
jgi:lipoprotein NlpI